MSAKRLHKVMVLVMLIFIVAPTLALAAGGLPTQIVPEDCNGTGGCQKLCDLAELAENILNGGIYLAVFLSAVLFAWAGLKMLTSVGNSGERTRAKEIFTNVAIGLVIILASWLVVDTVMRTLLGANFGPWNSIC